jgi:hypothetical protein
LNINIELGKDLSGVVARKDAKDENTLLIGEVIKELRYLNRGNLDKTIPKRMEIAFTDQALYILDGAHGG